jgi:hypothetical protein
MGSARAQPSGYKSNNGIALMLVLIGLCGCTTCISYFSQAMPGMVLEKEDTWDFRIVEFGPPRVLQISGMSGHSSFAVSGIKVIRKGSELGVFVHLAVGREGLCAGFDRTLPIPPGVKKVRFGKKKTEIWSEPGSVE